MRKNILLIEDNLSFSPSGQEQLESLGHAVVVCPNAGVSVSRFLNARFDVIVLDLSLSSSALGGMGVIQSTRAMSLPIPPIVITSGHERTLIEWAAAKIQAFRWMQKPVADEQLAQMIEHATSPDCSAANVPILDPRFAA